MAHDATHNSPSPASTKHLAIAIVVAAIVVFGARWLTDKLTHAPAPQALATLPAIATSEAVADDAQIVAEARKARQEREHALIEQDRALREQKRADALRARDEAALASQADETRKNAAWQRYFKPAPKCANTTDDATRIDCSNQYLRAKERFEKAYADGKL